MKKRSVFCLVFMFLAFFYTRESFSQAVCKNHMKHHENIVDKNMRNRFLEILFAENDYGPGDEYKMSEANDRCEVCPRSDKGYVDQIDFDVYVIRDTFGNDSFLSDIMLGKYPRSSTFYPNESVLKVEKTYNNRIGRNDDIFMNLLEAHWIRYLPKDKKEEVEKLKNGAKIDDNRKNIADIFYYQKNNQQKSDEQKIEELQRKRTIYQRSVALDDLSFARAYQSSVFKMGTDLEKIEQKLKKVKAYSNLPCRRTDRFGRRIDRGCCVNAQLAMNTFLLKNVMDRSIERVLLELKFLRLETAHLLRNDRLQLQDQYVPERKDPSFSVGGDGTGGSGGGAGEFSPKPKKETRQIGGSSDDEKEDEDEDEEPKRKGGSSSDTCVPVTCSPCTPVQCTSDELLAGTCVPVTCAPCTPVSCDDTCVPVTCSPCTPVQCTSDELLAGTCVPVTCAPCTPVSCDDTCVPVTCAPCTAVECSTEDLLAGTCVSVTCAPCTPVTCDEGENGNTQDSNNNADNGNDINGSENGSGSGNNADNGNDINGSENGSGSGNNADNGNDINSSENGSGSGNNADGGNTVMKKNLSVDFTGQTDNSGMLNKTTKEDDDSLSADFGLTDSLNGKACASVECPTCSQNGTCSDESLNYCSVCCWDCSEDEIQSGLCDKIKCGEDARW